MGLARPPIDRHGSSRSFTVSNSANNRVPYASARRTAFDNCSSGTVACRPTTWVNVTP